MLVSEGEGEREREVKDERSCDVQPDCIEASPTSTTPTLTSPFVHSYLLFSLSSQVLLIQPSAHLIPPPTHQPSSCFISYPAATNSHFDTWTHTFLQPALLSSLLFLHYHFHISIFSALSRAAGGSWRAVTYPIAALESALAHRHGRKTERQADRQAARNSSTPDLYLYPSLRGLIRLLSPAQPATVAAKSRNRQIHTA